MRGRKWVIGEPWRFSWVVEERNGQEEARWNNGWKEGGSIDDMRGIMGTYR